MGAVERVRGRLTNGPGDLRGEEKRACARAGRASQAERQAARWAGAACGAGRAGTRESAGGGPERNGGEVMGHVLEGTGPCGEGREEEKAGPANWAAGPILGGEKVLG